MDFLLPLYPGLKLEKTYLTTDRLLLFVNSTHPTALCPSCQIQSERIHSYYIRLLKDLTWAVYIVGILLLTKHFYCDNPACAKTTFAEPFGSMSGCSPIPV